MLLSDGLRGAILGYFTQIGVAVVYLSAFHMLRVQICKAQAEAHLAELRRRHRRQAGLRVKNYGTNGGLPDGEVFCPKTIVEIVR